MTKRYKNWFFYIISIILSLIFAINISICIYAKSSTEYKFSLKKGSTISAIAINNNILDLSNFENSDISKKKDSNTLIVNNDTNLIIKTSVIDDISFRTSKNNDVTITKDKNIKKIGKNGFYSNHISTIDIIRKSINIYTLLYLILGFIIFSFAIKEIINFIDKINKNNISIKDVILFFICNFVIFAGVGYVLLLLSKILVIVSLILYLTYMIYKTKDNLSNYLEYAYVIFITIIGLSFLFFLPPLNVPDEPEHFIKSYNMLDSNSYGDKGLANLSDDVYSFVNYYKYTSMDYNLEFNSKNYLDSYFIKNSDNTHILSYRNTKDLSIIPYIPSSIIISIGRLLDCSPLVLLILGRGINLLITLILCYYALKSTPYFKKIFFIIMLLPMFIQQSAAINMDWLTNSISMLFIAKILQLKYQTNNISKIEIAKLFILGLILSFCKFGFFPITFLILLIPSKKFKEIKKPVLLKTILILTVILVSYFNNLNSIQSAGSSVGPYYTLKYALMHPINTIYVYINTFLNRFDSDIFKGQFDSFGVYTKYNKSLFTTLLIIMYGILLLCKDDNDKKLQLKERLLYLFVTFVMILIPYTAMFLGWTNIGSNFIEGLQPRYFLVAELILFITLSSNLLNINIKNKNLLYICCVMFNFFISIFTIIVGFY